ncbi:class I SAM-dependent methyltransferase [Spiroplasma sp. BIUS-1]|uniref:tRNA (adenine(22)-N(1))-methyltransferase n=1 Tax=Spiroplasma sp. BIUS-1 TaxID=216964 RepID=UPI001399523B|nr:class I SAM-dependent methyltransferase [Spiroplasma sp. BIUS-1]QHX36803.1 tRNA (adenine22-N1)-methyltransferase [Spiroplasma sp. BIUS-1]
MSFLTPRLFSLASLITEGEVVADIGTDHAYLPIYLAKDGKAKKIYATDVSLGPLNVAKNNLASFGVADKVETILADGIEWTIPNKIKLDSCIIAGMGSTSILDILKKDNENIYSYIIASNTSLEPIRIWTKQKKYFVEKELIVEDNKIIYEIIKINKFAGTKIKNKKDILFGPILIKDENNKLFLQKWLEEEEKLFNLLQQIPKKDKKYKEILNRKKEISKLLKRRTLIND